MYEYQKVCRVCGAVGDHPAITAREMMFGTREIFEYFKCTECGCLQISSIPPDLSRFYPPTYYSLNPKTSSSTEKAAARKILERLRIRNALFGRGYKLAKLASKLVDFPPQLGKIGPWLRKSNIHSFNARFLDVGCGSTSWWLSDLKELGFHNLVGVDPYISGDIEENGIRILKRQLEQTPGLFDLVTLHHSLEHVPEQLETLKSIHSLLSPGGFCLIRIPLVSSKVWEEYGVDWVELDAPRHLYLHTTKSIEHVANQAGFRLIYRSWDSTEFEFLGSEQYRQDIPLMAENSFVVNKDNSNFTYREVAKFKMLADEANKSGTGGRGCFFFQTEKS